MTAFWTTNRLSRAQFTGHFEVANPLSNIVIRVCGHTHEADQVPGSEPEEEEAGTDGEEISSAEGNLKRALLNTEPMICPELSRNAQEHLWSGVWVMNPMNFAGVAVGDSCSSCLAI